MSQLSRLATPAFVATCNMRSGLGNRLRLVLSSQTIADAERRSFYYHWPVGVVGKFQFGARFDELWEYRGGVALDTPGPEPMLRFDQVEMSNLATVRGDAVISVTGNTLIPGYGNNKWWGGLLAKMHPTEEVSAIANPLLEQLGDRFIGVQVRAHPTLTHKRTLAESPVSWFIARMRELRDQHPGTSFFLSCDHPEAQDQIIETVPGVLALSKTGDYNSRQGLIESVADLVTLSRSIHILEPYASTFAKIAWLMGERRMPIESSVKSERAVRPGKTSSEQND